MISFLHAPKTLVPFQEAKPSNQPRIGLLSLDRQSKDVYFLFFIPPEVDLSSILIFKFVVSYFIGFSFPNVCFFFFNLQYDENNTTFRKVKIWLLIF